MIPSLILAVVFSGLSPAPRPYAIHAHSTQRVCAPHAICDDMRIIRSDSNGSALATQCANWFEPGADNGIGNPYLDFHQYIIGGGTARRYELWGRWENPTNEPQVIGDGFYSLVCHQI